MKRRILAWIALILFVVLTTNILIFKFMQTESIILYGLMIAMFFFTRVFDKQGSYYGPAQQPDLTPDEETMDEESEEIDYEEVQEDTEDSGDK